MSNYNILFEEIIRKISDQVTDNIMKAINPSITPEEDRFLTIEETSKIIDLAKPSIYGLVHKNKIPFHKKSKRLYFLKSEILDWIKSGKQSTKSDLEIRANEYLSKNRLF
jgi:excisionase family DNA binding protein